MSTALALYASAAVIVRPDERARVARLVEACERIAAAGHGGTVPAIKAEARALGIGEGSMRRTYYAWRAHDGDAWALADKRKEGRAAAAGNRWLQTFLRYCENDKNTSSNAWRAMMQDFRNGYCQDGAPYGEVFAGVGTWRDEWQREHPHGQAPEQYPSGWVPERASKSTLCRLARRQPDHLFQVAASRRGRQAAQDFLTEVLKTRMGVPVGAIRQWDDVWHNFDVRLPGNASVAQPLEFAGYDVASAYKCDSVVKPRFTRLDGKRDNLKEQTFRFVFAAAHCVTGFYKGGIVNIVEHGTAAIRDHVRQQIKLIPQYGQLIRFEQSGILSEQVHAGLFMGSGGGNFRMKPLVESSHGKLADRAAHLPGNRGRDAETMHESRNALVRYEERLMLAASRLAPDVAAMIEYGLMTFEEYLKAYREIERGFFSDCEHCLEGWDAKQVQEYAVVSTPGASDWHNVRDLLDKAPDEARAIAAFLKLHPQCVRQRYMSRVEVWKSGQVDLIRVPLMEMPAFLDERDMIELTVRDNGTVDFSNGYFYGRDKMIYRVDSIRTPAGYTTRLAPGARLLVKYNPLVPDHIWIIDGANGATVGMAPLHERAPMMDRAAIERSMGVQAHDLARKVMPVRGRHQPEAVGRAGRMGRNQAALLGLAACLPVDNQTISPDGDASAVDAAYDDVPDAMAVAADMFTADAPA